LQLALGARADAGVVREGAAKAEICAEFDCPAALRPWLEEAVFDADGNLITGTFADYLLPSAADLPSFVTDRTTTPATTNPLGVKGVGEAGTIASTPAVMNAVMDAVRHLGVRSLDMPATPERVWRAIHEAQQAPANAPATAGGVA
jgi:carbon-monoxide dehydrogenase large subunit